MRGVKLAETPDGQLSFEDDTVGSLEILGLIFDERRECDSP
jgi:hypothetical protein